MLPVTAFGYPFWMYARVRQVAAKAQRGRAKRNGPKSWAVAAVSAGHLALITCLAVGRPPPAPATDLAGDHGAAFVTLVAVRPSHTRPAAARPRLRLHRPVSPPELPAPTLLPALVEISLTAPAADPAFDIETTPLLDEAFARAAGDPNTPCRLDALLQGALSVDPRVLRALQLMPRSDRSVANAIMLWNGRWTNPAALGGPAVVDPLRGAIVDRLRLARSDCREATIHGPVFIFVPSGSETTVLTVGSGEWRWGDLLG